MVKLIGCICIFFACVGIGGYFAKRVKIRREILQKLKRNMILLRGDIAYAGTSLPEAMQSLLSDKKDIVSVFFSEVSQKLIHSKELPLQKVWTEKIEFYFNDGTLTKEDIKRLKEVGNTLGSISRQKQIDSLNLYIEQLEMELQEGEKESQNTIKVYHALGVAAGAMTVLILI